MPAPASIRTGGPEGGAAALAGSSAGGAGSLGEAQVEHENTSRLVFGHELRDGGGEALRVRAGGAAERAHVGRLGDRSIHRSAGVGVEDAEAQHQRRAELPDVAEDDEARAHGTCHLGEARGALAAADGLLLPLEGDHAL
jgi:hypothetical protein